eukprot:2302523-Pyramimonas_sp.AAC.1
MSCIMNPPRIKAILRVVTLRAVERACPFGADPMGSPDRSARSGGTGSRARVWPPRVPRDVTLAWSHS